MSSQLIPEEGKFITAVDFDFILRPFLDVMVSGDVAVTYDCVVCNVPERGCGCWDAEGVVEADGDVVEFYFAEEVVAFLQGICVDCGEEGEGKEGEQDRVKVHGYMVCCARQVREHRGGKGGSSPFMFFVRGGNPR